MRSRTFGLLHFLSLVLSCGILLGGSARGDMVTSLSQLMSDKTFTLTNNGTSAATVAFSLSGTLTVTTAMSGTGSASGGFSGSIMQGSTVLFTAPSSGTFSTTIDFDVPAGTSTVFTSTSMANAMASASSPSGSATATASDDGTSSFLTASPNVSLTVVTSPASYTLSVAGDNPPVATGLASFDVMAGGATVFSDSLTTGSKTVPLTSTVTQDLTPNVAFTASASSIDTAQASVVPEPATLLAALEAVGIGLIGCAWRRRRPAT